MRDRTPRPLDREGLWTLALRALGARAHSVGELREKLSRRARDPDDVKAVLARLKERGYLDDRQFAQAFSASRLENQGFGRMRVLRDLRKRRVARAVAEGAVDQVYGETDEAGLIEEYLRRKYRGTALETWLAEPRNLAAAYRRLRTAGFSAGNCLHVLKRFAREPELLDSLEEAPEDEPGQDPPASA